MALEEDKGCSGTGQKDSPAKSESEEEGIKSISSCSITCL
jgi:hypothetical protein